MPFEYPNNPEYLARTLLEVLQTSEGRALLDQLDAVRVAERGWHPSYIIDEIPELD